MVRHIPTLGDSSMLGDKISDYAQDEYLHHPLARDELSA